MPKYVDVENAGVGLCRPEIFTDLQYGEGWNAAIHYFMDIAPAADVEPKRKSGRWIIAGAFDDFYQCPECGEMWPIFSTIEWKCCPICECKIITNRPKGEENAE